MKPLRPLTAALLSVLVPTQSGIAQAPAQDSEVVIMPTGEAILRWQAKEGRTYFIQGSDPNDPLGTWIWSDYIEHGHDHEISHEVGSTADKAFFRLHYTDTPPPAGVTLEDWDADGDGLPNALELAIQTNPLNPDSSGDGIPDGWAYAHGLNPTAHNAAGSFQGSPTTNLGAYQQGVQANPNSTIVDYDGDGLDNDLDADPQDQDVDWEKANISSYIMIEIDVPAEAGYARDLNDDGQVLFGNGVWSAGAWTELPKAEASGEVNGGYHIYESNDSVWKYFGPEGKILGEIELDLHSGQSDFVDVPHVSLFTPGRSPSISTETIEWLDPFLDLRPIGIDQQGRIFAKKANYIYSETGLNNEIWLLDGNLTKIGAYPLPVHQRSSFDWHLTPSGWLAHWLWPSLEPESSGTYRCIVWNPQGNEISMPGTPSPYVTSMTDLPNGKPVITAYDPGNWQPKVYLFPGTGSAFKKSSGLSDKNIGLFAGDGTAMTSDGKMWINGELIPIRDLCPPYGELQDEDWSFQIHKANRHGIYLIQAHGGGESKPMLLLPIELKDIQGPGDEDDRHIQSMDPVPKQEQGESVGAYCQRLNAYYQQQVPDRSIAYIDPHRGANDSPDMPQLMAKIPGGPEGLKVRWRLEVEYLRGNGYRTRHFTAAMGGDYAHLNEQWGSEEDTVKIPNGTTEGQPNFTAVMNANEEWRIFDAWESEVAERGFFGGTAKLFVWFPDAQEEAPSDPIMTFRIGGKNPDQAKAKAFINEVVAGVDSRLWFAYAIAKHETHGRVRENDTLRYYNQFYNQHQGGPIGDASVDMGWAGWAKAWPLYNLDRGRRKDRTRYQNGPGGYGIYQVTGNSQDSKAVIPRRQLWNWQNNAEAGVAIIRTKAQFVDARFTKLQETYPTAGAVPTYPLVAVNNRRRLTGWDAYVVTGYNGFGGCIRVRINGFGNNRQWTCWDPQQGSWRFVHNMNRYCENLYSLIEETE